MKKIEKKKERPLTQLSKSKKYMSPEKHLPLSKVLNQKPSPSGLKVPYPNSPQRSPQNSISARQVYQTPKFNRKSKPKVSKRSLKRAEKKHLKKQRPKKKEKVHIIEDFIDRSFLETEIDKELKEILQENQDPDSFFCKERESTAFRSLDQRDLSRSLADRPQNTHSSSMSIFPLPEIPSSNSFINLQACIRRFLAQTYLKEIQESSVELTKLSSRDSQMLSLENELNQHREWRNSFLQTIHKLRDIDLSKLQLIDTEAGTRDAFKNIITERYHELALLMKQTFSRRSSELSSEQSVIFQLEKMLPLAEPLSSDEPITASFEEILFMTQVYEDGVGYIVSDSPLYPSVSEEDLLAPAIHEELLEEFFNQIQSEILIELSYTFPHIFVKDVLAQARKKKEDVQEALLTPNRAELLNTLFVIQEQEIGEPLIADFKTKPVLQAEFGQNKMIVDALNQSLNSFRKYGNSGEPFLWSYKNRVFSNQIDTDGILNSAEKIAFEWIASNTHDIEDQIGNLLEFDIIESEYIWNELDLEETQVKLDLSEIILENLVFEIINLV